MKIRRFRKRDEEEVKKLINKIIIELFNEPIYRWENFENYTIFYVVEKNGKVIGTAALKDEKNKIVRLKRMYIKRYYRKKGIGTKLLLKIEKFAKNKGFKKIILSTYKQMKNSYLFYKANGFNIIKKQNDAIFMEKKLWKPKDLKSYHN